MATAVRLNAEAKTLAEDPESNTRSNWRATPVDKIDETTLENVVNFAFCHISPIAAFLGGVVAQKVVKFTGKFTPIRQWLYFDAFETLLKNPPSGTVKNGGSLTLRNCRHGAYWLSL